MHCSCFGIWLTVILNIKTNSSIRTPRYVVKYNFDGGVVVIVSCFTDLNTFPYIQKIINRKVKEYEENATTKTTKNNRATATESTGNSDLQRYKTKLMQRGTQNTFGIV